MKNYVDGFSTISIVWIETCTFVFGIVTMTHVPLTPRYAMAAWHRSITIRLTNIWSHISMPIQGAKS
jgi:hypothetical protein